MLAIQAISVSIAIEWVVEDTPLLGLPTSIVVVCASVGAVITIKLLPR